MSRSPFAYPLARGIDSDSGGAADLQTDIMRFMAILSLCLVAIFALVQSLPMAAETPDEPVTVSAAEPVPRVIEAATAEPAQAAIAPASEQPSAAARSEDRPVVIRRPQWVPEFQPAHADSRMRLDAPVATAPQSETDANPPTVSVPTPAETPAAVPDEEPGFTLRFASDLALTRLVANGRVGFFAIDDARALRMAVSDSRISFWDASSPNSFHEMEAATVPQPVVEALARTGADIDAIAWGVTLPGKLRRQLDTLMSEHSGGALVISADGNLSLEAS